MLFALELGFRNKSVAARLTFTTVPLTAAVALFASTALGDPVDPADVSYFETEGPRCALPFSPFVHELATPADMACDLDADDDGLSDEIEGLVAECFSPLFRFDADEGRLINSSFSSRRRLADCSGDVVPCVPGGAEPVALFNLEPPASGMTAKLVWAFLYHWDGGFWDAYVNSNLHEGDSEVVDMEVEFRQNVPGYSADRWVAELTWVRVNNEWSRDVPGWPYLQKEDESWQVGPVVVPSPLGGYTELAFGQHHFSVYSSVERLEVVGDTHPVVYPTAGKHHQSLLPVPAYVYSDGWFEIDGARTTIYEHTDRGMGGGEAYLPPTSSRRFVDPDPSSAVSTRSSAWHNVGRLAPHLGAINYAPPADCAKRDALQQIAAGYCETDCEGGCDPEGYGTEPGQPCSPENCAHPNPLQQCPCCEPIPPHCEPSPENEATCEALRDILDDYQDLECGQGWGNFAAVDVNYCDLHRDPEQQNPSASFVSDRDFMNLWGYGESLGDDRPFCGTSAPGCSYDEDEAATAPLVLLQYRGPEFGGDADEDGVLSRLDLCPTLTNEAGYSDDEDADGAGDSCDPHVHRFDRWVALGEALTNRRAYDPAASIAPDWSHAGWLDTDQDGVLNGADMCPTSGWHGARDTTNVNEWGETTDFASYGLTEPLTRYYDMALSTIEYKPTRAHLGLVERADACDPYEVTFLSHPSGSPADLWDSSCTEAVKTVGTGPIEVAYQPDRGISANDPAPSGAPMPVNVDLRRCGCPDWDSEPERCLNPQFGACPQEMPFRDNQHISVGTGWLPVEETGCTHAKPGSGTPEGYCKPFASQAPLPNVGGLPEKFTWSWEQEYESDATRPASAKHFPAGWVDNIEDTYGTPYNSSQVGFTFASETLVTQAGNDLPLVHPAHARKVGNEADVSPAIDPKSAPGIDTELPDWDRRTRRFRAYFSESWVRPAGYHQARLIPGPDCFNLTKYDRFWWLRPLDDPWSRVRPRVFDRVQPLGPSLLANRDDASKVFLVDLASSAVSTVRVLNGDSLGSIRDLFGAPVELAASFIELDPPGDAFPWSVAPVGASGQPDMPMQPRLVVTGFGFSVGAAWWLLHPTTLADQEGSAIYEVVDAGLAPSWAPGATLLADADGAHVVAYREGTGMNGRWAASLDLESRTWTTPDLVQSELRDGAQVLVRNGYIFRIGGRDGGGAVHGDVLRIDFRSGLTDRLPGVGAEPFPPRSGGVASWATDGEAIVVAGGVGADGVSHADVWALRRGDREATCTVADTPGDLAPSILEGALVVASAWEPGAHVWGPATEKGASFGHRMATPEGWRELDLRTGADLARRCEDGASPTICSPSESEWWADTGERCEETGCVARTAPETAITKMLGAAAVRDIDISAGRVWVGRGTTVEVWDVTLPGSAVKKAWINVDGPVRAIAADAAGALVGTVNGVRRLRLQTGSLQLAGGTQAVCGRPIDIVPFAHQRWLVYTTAGVAIADEDGQGGIRVAARAILKDAGGPKLEPVSDNIEGRSRCAAQDLAHVAQSGLEPPRPGRAAVFDGEHFDIVRGDRFIRLEVQDSSILLSDWIGLPGRATATRVDGRRAYVVGRHPGGADDVIVNLAISLAIERAHDVRAWILRRDDGLVRVRQDGPCAVGKAEVAWVQR